MAGGWRYPIFGARYYGKPNQHAHIPMPTECESNHFPLHTHFYINSLRFVCAGFGGIKHITECHFVSCSVYHALTTIRMKAHHLMCRSISLAFTAFRAHELWIPILISWNFTKIFIQKALLCTIQMWSKNMSKNWSLSLSKTVVGMEFRRDLMWSGMFVSENSYEYRSLFCILHLNIQATNLLTNERSRAPWIAQLLTTERCNFREQSLQTG